MYCNPHDLQEIQYEKTLPTGLHVTLFSKPHFATSCVMLTCKAGSLSETDALTCYPAGTAHFLEHKLFEHHGMDATHAFSLLGATVNAWTSYEETVCYFETTAADIQKPLLLLLSLVKHGDWQEASVNRERNIILEENNSYMQDPENRLFLETMQSLYPNQPLARDITGTHDSIRKISRVHLQHFYERYYAFANMYLTIVTPQCPKQIFAGLERWAPAASPGPHAFQPHIALKQNTVPVRPVHSFSMPAQSARIMCGYRLHSPKGSPIQRAKAEWELYIALELWFSPLHEEYQRWLDRGIISVNFAYDLTALHDFCYLLFSDEQKNPEFAAWIDRQLCRLKQACFRPESFIQLQKRIYGELVQSFDTPMRLCEVIADHTLHEITIFDELRLISRITLKSCMERLEQTDFSTHTTTFLQI